MAKENTVMMTDYVMISNAAPRRLFACLFVIFDDVSAN